MLSDATVALRVLQGLRPHKRSLSGVGVGNGAAHASPARKSILGVYLLCILPAALSVCLSVLLEVVQALRLQLPEVPVAVLAACFLIIAVPLTHGISGKTMHPTWRFYQPLIGGRKFITIQLFSWLFFALAIVEVGAWFLFRVENHTGLPGLWACAGLACVASESLMLASLQTFDANEAPLPAVSLRQMAWNAVVTVRTVAFLAVASNTAFVLLFFMLAPFLLVPSEYSVYVAVTFWTLYSFTYINKPEDTGARRWDWFRRSFVMDDVIRYFNGKVIIDTGDIDQSRNYIFALAPHGIMPLTGMWLPNHPTFYNFFKGLDVYMLGASIFHMMPIVRDIPMWGGTRQVTRRTFVATLREGKSALMVPGGISELHVSKSTSKTIKVVTRHKGFIKVAFETGTPLIPVYSFGETLYFDYINVKYISKFMYKYLGTPIPYFVGVGNFLQFPRRKNVTVVVGKPIDVPHIANPTQEQIDEVHKKFYDGIAELFERHKHECGHGDFTLQLISSKHSHKQPSKDAAPASPALQ